MRLLNKRPWLLLAAVLLLGCAHSVQEWESPLASMPPPVRTGLWTEGLASIDPAHEAGVPIALGTDANNPFVFPGHVVHLELELLVEAGLTPMEALEAATRRPAEMLGKDDEFGTIEAGQRADLLVLAADPLADIRNTRALEVAIRSGDILDWSSGFEAWSEDFEKGDHLRRDED